MVKSSDTAMLGEPGVITYTFEFSNTGNATLNNLTLVDNDIDSGSLVGCPIASLAVGSDPVTCTATRTITQAQIDSGDDLLITQH